MLPAVLKQHQKYLKLEMMLMLMLMFNGEYGSKDYGRMGWGSC